jgi:flagellar assembly factor FliW
MKAMASIGRSIPVQSKDTVIHFDEGLIGFSDCKDFRVMEDDSIAPFHLLQSSQTKELGFLVLEPSVVMFDYYSRIPAREWESIGLSPSDRRLAFVICVIGASPNQSTGNFQAPLIVNYSKMNGRQLILTDAALSVRQPLM